MAPNGVVESIYGYSRSTFLTDRPTGLLKPVVSSYCYYLQMRKPLNRRNVLRHRVAGQESSATWLFCTEMGVGCKLKYELRFANFDFPHESYQESRQGELGVLRQHNWPENKQL